MFNIDRADLREAQYHSPMCDVASGYDVALGCDVASVACEVGWHWVVLWHLLG